MLQWGWRVPFLLALLPGGLAILGRLSIPESALFLTAADSEAQSNAATRAVSKTRELLASQWPQILAGVGALAGVSVLQYGGITWGLVSLKKKGLSSALPLLILTTFYSIPLYSLGHFWSATNLVTNKDPDSGLTD